MSASTPEQFARRIDELAARAADFDGGTIGATYDLAALIHDRDEQVRADERARVSVVHSTLTDEQLVAELVRRGVLEEKREDRLRPARVPCDCEHPTHAGLIGDDAPPTHAATQVVPVVQYATPWKRDTRTDEQRSDDAITALRRRLTGEGRPT